uniref:Putative secreted protein n=1 Tax=Anopheles marajoara TaxID=58244 RepID=A0A2M4C6M1_9DIPT
MTFWRWFGCRGLALVIYGTTARDSSFQCSSPSSIQETMAPRSNRLASSDFLCFCYTSGSFYCSGGGHIAIARSLEIVHGLLDWLKPLSDATSKANPRQRQRQTSVPCFFGYSAETCPVVPERPRLTVRSPTPPG